MDFATIVRYNLDLCEALAPVSTVHALYRLLEGNARDPDSDRGGSTWEGNPVRPHPVGELSRNTSIPSGAKPLHIFAPSTPQP